MLAAALATFFAAISPSIFSTNHSNNGNCDAQGGKNSVACSSDSGASVSQQALYTAGLLHDYQSLDRGVLSYTKVQSLKTAATLLFKITVTDAGRGKQLAPLTQFDGMTIYPADVPTGGIVGVQIVTCQNLTCQSLSDLQQPVLSKGDQADWYWNITAGTPGHAAITLRADTYDQGSTQTLHSEIININVNVVSTSAFDSQQTREKIANATKGIAGDIETIGAIATAIVAVGGIVGWIVMQKRKRRSSSDATSDKPSSGGNESADKSRDNGDEPTAAESRPMGNKPSGTGWPVLGGKPLVDEHCGRVVLQARD